MQFSGPVSRLVAGALVFGTAAFGASPQLLNLVMPDATTLADVNITTAKLSPFGGFLLTKLQSGNPGFAQLSQLTGFNPLTDVSEILAASADLKQHTGFVAALGIFNPDQIAGALANNENVTRSASPGVTVFTISGPKTADKTASVAFLGTTIAIAGDTPSVLAALERNSGNNALPAALAPQVTAVQASDAWVASDASLSSLVPAGPSGTDATQPGPAMAAQFLKSIQAFNAGVKFGDSTAASLNLTADTAQNAAALASVAQMLIGFGTAGASNDASANPQLAGLLAMLKNATVTASGPNVAIALSIPESQLEAIVSSHAGSN